MTDNIDIRESTEGDVAAIESFYPQAFPDEDLLPVLRELLQEPSGVLSLVACIDGTIVGHVMFSTSGVAGHDGRVELLGPLAVAPSLHKQGVGSALVRAGLERLASAGVTYVYVLGDPNYYGRFGFKAEDHVKTPYPIPEKWRAAWQSISLEAAESPTPLGPLRVPSPWRHQALWQP